MRPGLGVVVLAATQGLLLFASAGRLNLPWFWAYLAAWTGYALVALLGTARRDPALSSERGTPAEDRDPATRRFAVLPALGHWIVAGVHVGRLGGVLPTWAHIVGFALLGGGFALVVWTFRTNTFASSAVRIQSERAQRVITTGPYAWVRHPMYLGVLLVVLGSGPALGSWWAGVVVLSIIPPFVRRTRLEDRMLHEELPGYADYAARTRWKVVPGLW